ncbi:unnamed protein product [Citrullus colocynthis]|uniref:Major facilitator superfamily (MFS) profile domain-containing protein n=1 Tax=Citrullus colocynthis TaxID=252529 RepID=A0ABP0YKT8_9ROSI
MSAVGDVLSGEGIKEYPGKLTPFVTVTRIVAAIGGLIFGYDIAISVGLVANVVNHFTFKIKAGWGWRLSLGGAIIPALVITIGSILLPDTPKPKILMRKPKSNLEEFVGFKMLNKNFKIWLQLVKPQNNSNIHAKTCYRGNADPISVTIAGAIWSGWNGRKVAKVIWM